MFKVFLRRCSTHPRRKKMQFFELENFALPAKEIPTLYSPAKLCHNCQGWYMEYYFYNECIGQQERRRVLLNMYRKRYRTLAEFKVFANSVISSTNIKLMNGWTPYGQKQNSRNYLPLTEVCDAFIAEKGRELSTESIRSYKSFCNRLSAWVNDNYPGCQICQFTGGHAVEFMDYLYMTPSKKADPNSAWQQRLARAHKKTEAKEPKQMSANTYNGILKCGKAFWGWCVSKSYIKESPFDKLQPKHETEKKRDMIPQDVRKKIVSYIQKENPAFEIIYHLVMTSLIRPIEVERVQIRDIDLQNHCINLPGSKTKNHHARTAPLTDRTCELLAKHIAGVPDNYYLFDSQYKASSKPTSSDSYGRWWAKMRKELCLDDSYQLYSLRDTGMNTMMTECGLDPVTVMETADHSDLSITTKYIKHFHGENVEKVRKAALAY